MEGQHKPKLQLKLLSWCPSTQGEAKRLPAAAHTCCTMNAQTAIFILDKKLETRGGDGEGARCQATLLRAAQTMKLSKSCSDEFHN